MMKKTAQYLVALFILLIFSGQALAVNMEAGKWEITSRIEMPGMPMQMPPMTNVQCLTQEDPAPSNTAAGGSAECGVADMKTEGNTVIWKVKCNSDGEEVTSQGKITYHGTTFEGVVTTVTDQAGEPMEMKTFMNGKRVGNCE